MLHGLYSESLLNIGNQANKLGPTKYDGTRKLNKGNRKKAKNRPNGGQPGLLERCFEWTDEVTARLPRRVKGGNALASTFSPALNGDRKT
jgi:hypothetical protein